MKSWIKIGILLALIVGIPLGTVTALTASEYQISWWTVDSGGGISQSTNGQYTVQGTIGQPDAGSAAGSAYTLDGGFWHGITTAIREWFVHLPLVIR